MKSTNLRGDGEFGGRGRKLGARLTWCGLVAMFALGLTMESVGADRSLAERLGYGVEDRLLIINGDDVGMCHAANVASIDSLENGLMTSATIMVPCPWFPEIAAYAAGHPGVDLGVHLTHTSEWKKYRWGPVSSRESVPGLVDPQGYLWPSVAEVYANATPEEAEREGRAQIVKALQAGIDITHLDSHMGALQYDIRYHGAYQRLALEFDLPLRMASQETLVSFGAGQLRAELAREGILCPDYLIHGGRKSGEAVGAYWRRMLSELRPGVTELYIHASVDGEELRQITGSWRERVAEYELFTRDAEIRAARLRPVENRGIQSGPAQERGAQRAFERAMGRPFIR
jgi:chitin disaccharide deacetylase